MLNELQNKKIYSVSELNNQSRQILEKNIGRVYLKGECSSLNIQQQSQHWYFTLKDKDASIQCVMFRNNVMKLNYTPKVGDSLLVKGVITLYEARGNYQLIADYLQKSGVGDLYLAFSQMKNKLQQEGLFEVQHKKQLPDYIAHVGVITSASGAVIQDIITTLKRRAPAILVSIIPSAVQGEKAKYELVAAIDIAEATSNIDVIILARGGGSIEDLWAFNEEIVARRIFACNKPIISAVGHETDYSIADFIADKRAATPSIAAELISASLCNVSNRLQEIQRKIIKIIVHKLEIARLTLSKIYSHLITSKQIIFSSSQRLDEFTTKLHNLYRNKLHYYQHTVTNLEKRLIALDPQQKLFLYAIQLNSLHEKMHSLMQNKLKEAMVQLKNYAKMLNAVSPLAVMSRGYSIVKKDNKVISDTKKLQVNDKLNLLLHKGKVDCKVVNIDSQH